MSFRFEPRGLLALAPQAYGQTYESVVVDTPPPPVPTVAIVSIRGPLMHHPQPWGRDNTPPPDCYDDIRCRVAYALNTDAQCVILAIDSPGGLVNGCFETARTIKAMAAAAGKLLYAYIDGQCCSAAYALACACSMIFAPETAIVGSIGVLDCMVDATKADGQLGLKFQLISSGARKTDGNVHTVMTDEAIAAAQARVDDLAAFFFAFVADNRNGLSVDDVRALQAETFTGSRALSLQLVDGVLTLDSLVASLTANPSGIQMAKYDDSMAALMAEADGDDPKKATRAKKALAAMFAADADGDDKPKPKDDEEAESDADDEGDDADKKKKDDEAKAAAAAASATASAAPAAVAQAPVAAPAAVASSEAVRLDRVEREQREARALERRNLLASRPDLSAEQRAIFGDSKQTPLAMLRAILPTLTKGTTPAEPTGASAAAALAAQTATGAPTQGGAPTGAARLTAATPELQELNERMGISAMSTKPTISVQNGKHVFSVISDAVTAEGFGK